MKDVVGGDVSAKDFRTWHGTVLAAVALADRADDVGSATRRKKAVRTAMVEVAQYLGNTPTVARGSYVDPRVIDAFEAGTTIAPTLRHARAADAASPSAPATPSSAPCCGSCATELHPASTARAEPAG